MKRLSVLLAITSACAAPVVDNVTGANVTVLFDASLALDSLDVSLLVDDVAEVIRVVPDRRRRLRPEGETFAIALLDDDVDRSIALRIDGQFDLETRASALIDLPLRRGQFVDVEVTLGTPGVVGDGRIGDVETCDDGNAEPRDGCNDRGLIESGWACEGEPSVCTPLCGDGIVITPETCDRGELNGTYDPDPTVSCNATCDAPGSHCGDGENDAAERCDFGVANGAWGPTEDTSCNTSCSGPAAYCGDGQRDFADGELCDEGALNDVYADNPQQTCNATCDGPAPFCGDGVLDDEEVCDDGVLNGAYNRCQVDCTGFGARCGDGVVQPAFELCDAGALNGAYSENVDEACNVLCNGRGPHCGDGVKDDDEVCDDGVQNGSYNRCAVGCGAFGPTCGDGEVQPGFESCDLGGATGSYALNGSATCASTCFGRGPHCGDAVTQTADGESCDDGLSNGSYGACDETCSGPGPRCGDGVVEPAFELCDDGPNNGQAGFCDAFCGVEGEDTCGDGVVDAGEDCDDLTLPRGDCDVDCTFSACGDGTFNPLHDPGTGLEACDEGADNDRFPFYGCDATCQTKTSFCGDGVVDEDYLEVCDEGAGNLGYGSLCDVDCTPAPFCGDGIVQEESGEVCDLANENGAYGSIDSPGCSADCRALAPRCGDGQLDTFFGEHCDLGDAGNIGAYGGCLPNCKRGPFCGDGQIFSAVEQCDLGDATFAGCTSCQIDPGSVCQGQPSVCANSNDVRIVPNGSSLLNALDADETFVFLEDGGRYTGLLLIDNDDVSGKTVVGHVDETGAPTVVIDRVANGILVELPAGGSRSIAFFNVHLRGGDGAVNFSGEIVDVAPNSSVRIENSLVSGSNNDDGVRCIGGSVTVVRSRVFNNAQAGINAASNCVLQIESSMFYDNGGAGVGANNVAPTSVIQFNTLVLNDQGINCQGAAVPVDYNLSVHNGEDGEAAPMGICVVESTDKVIPLGAPEPFIDIGQRDLRLRPDADVTSTTTPVNAPLDIHFDPRPLGRAVDFGADEIDNRNLP